MNKEQAADRLDTLGTSLRSLVLNGSLKRCRESVQKSVFDAGLDLRDFAASLRKPPTILSMTLRFFRIFVIGFFAMVGALTVAARMGWLP